MYSQKRQKGNIAEDLVVNKLKDSKYKILERNYLIKFGEIDIIAQKNDIIHFIEVKSISNESAHVSCETWEVKKITDYFNTIVSRETIISSETTFDPAWNMTSKKKKSLAKTIKIYIFNNYKQEIPEFQIDLITVSLDYLKKIAYISIIDNIILGEL